MLDKNLEDLLTKYMFFLEKYETKSASDSFILRKFFCIGILDEIIFSRAIFKRNLHLKTYIEDHFGIPLSKTTVNSRPLMSGQVNNYILSINDEEELNNILNSIYKILRKVEKNIDINDKDINDIIQELKI